MEKTLVINVSDEDIIALRDAQVELETIKENVSSLLDLHANEKEWLNKPIMKELHKEQMEAKSVFERLKTEVSKKYIPDYLYNKHEYAWNIDYNTKLLTITITCSCGIKEVEAHQ